MRRDFDGDGCWAPLGLYQKQYHVRSIFVLDLKGIVCIQQILHAKARGTEDVFLCPLG